MNNDKSNWSACPECQGRGKKVRRLRKKVRLSYQRALEHFEKSNSEGSPPVRPKGHRFDCENCSGTGLVEAAELVIADTENYPHIAIIGGGIGGVALAIACQHRGIPFTLYERDNNFSARSQGYGLTLQQASKAIAALGILTLDEGVISTRHLVHTTEGKVIGEWGIRKWHPSDVKNSVKRRNIHIARQSLRLALLKQLGEGNAVQWSHQLIEIKENLVTSNVQENEETKDQPIELTFNVNGELKHAKADLVVGADGIRSSVRQLLIGDEFIGEELIDKEIIGNQATALRYLDCIVILGICPLADIEGLEPADNELLDSATVFQTANGHERIYIMPFDANSVMWQLSFPMSEIEATALSAQGAQALKAEAIHRCDWHTPIPQILVATKQNKISGYPVYDRELLSAELLAKNSQVTLIGDAAHPMSPFKGQGANQAILDALSLARQISTSCRPLSNWREKGIRASALTEFEAEMLMRSASKVKDSAEAAEFLHSDVVLHEGDEPRGRCLKRE
ncbi:FAD-dependent oxidoreductase [Colwellia echini]|uniref:FAD-dependent monooxygenase n=1 Tax=Colwellia echini TaxID=1982103 RepID=A0ABY3N0S4_9GAMM|nr:NAD(P)/FAD-dependent oxidoreductase [Colwellia echini]TYK67058.1 FAD-dependent monooxygenase [Colwellia echini]